MHVVKVVQKLMVFVTLEDLCLFGILHQLCGVSSHVRECYMDEQQLGSVIGKRMHLYIYHLVNNYALASCSCDN